MKGIELKPVTIGEKGDNLYVHIPAFLTRNMRLRKGQRLKPVMAEDRKGFEMRRID